MDGRSGGGDVSGGARQRTQVREENERAILDSAMSVFAELGFKGATTAAIAERAGLPKANVHYYFPSKDDLYRAVMARVLETWLAAADSLDGSRGAEEALARYIEAKMDLSRSMPEGSRIFASEIMRGAPAIADHLETTLKEWLTSRGAVVRRWIADGQIAPLEPAYLFYMIWATTQHYADFARQIEVLNGGQLTDAQFAAAKRQVVDTILRGILVR